MAISDSPVMLQYRELKAQYPHYLLFFRMGDFYELFENDAVVASSLLDITLTQRRSKKDEDGIPMCGVPFHAADGYIGKLLDAGHRVALCEQVETPEQAKKRAGSKALVKRAVVRLYTGGTLIEDSFLPSDRAAVLAAIARQGDAYALAWLDMAGATSGVVPCDAKSLTSELAALQPAELLVQGQTAQIFKAQLKPYSLTEDERVFADAQIETALTDAFADALPKLDAVCTKALGAVVAYARQTQLGRLPALRPPQKLNTQTALILDDMTRRHLELTHTLSGEKNGSLLNAIDYTQTTPGSRMLRGWMQHPSRDILVIRDRQMAMQALQKQATVHVELGRYLKLTADLNRAVSRIGLDKGSPRDLGILRQTLGQLPHLGRVLEGVNDCPVFLNAQKAALCGFEGLSSLLTAALQDDPLPNLVRDGNFIKTGYNAELDAQRDLSSNGLEKLQALEDSIKAATNCSTLKLKYNKVWGYFFEVTKAQAASIPDTFIHRQTTTGTQRYSTPELMDLERKLSAADSTALEIETQVFKELTQEINANAVKLLDAAMALATLDALYSGTTLAQSHGYVWPVVDDSSAFTITEGRHPVVEQTVETFVPNDCVLDGQQIWLLTGPNMAGKSTFLRQNALIALMAHLGLPVPAKAAHIGVLDRIFSRLGAADDLARGQSTFMVEMTETAEILNNATSQSLVILDEIGRGTATYDGLAIAWACVEHLATANTCKGLFATHYHELTNLAAQLEHVSTHHVTVKEWRGDIVFQHTVKPGAAPRSYGIHVAKLAGLPTAALARAQDILQGLEQSSKGKKAANAADLPLFTAPVSAPISAPTEILKIEEPSIEPDPMREKLLEINLDTLSPREAQNLLYDLQIAAAMPARES